MAQSDIAEILENNYPLWMTYKDILNHTTINRRSVIRSLKCLVSMNEVEVRTEIIENSKQKTQTSYRIKPIIQNE